MVSKAQVKLNEKEAEEVVRLRSAVVYTAIKREGEGELERPLISLWWSGLAAGLAIFLSVISMGVLHHHLGDSPIIHFGYCIGFLVVILGRLQLFTENTITAVVPLLARPKKKVLYQTLRLWGIVFVANMIGILIASFAVLHFGMVNSDILASIVSISEHYIGRDAAEFLLQGIPAGFIVAAIVWMLPSSHGFEFWVIIVMTYLISLGGFTHVIAGAGEVFIMVMLDKISAMDAVFCMILPTLAGNIIGGTLLFALLAYGQVKEEI
ncbi:MAG: transporter (formate/nitrite transporter family protein) [Alphaproteobacteria bacterium CG11_big_fil_rev_8_21_14_0_20_44_7]|nr:MAG: transporter (formate/nitrite transporter family protein) [Alphaproteobacteria bacterium CG11_big_fil_rev_8_21_14_0_20_44_7]